MNGKWVTVTWGRKVQYGNITVKYTTPDGEIYYSQLTAGGRTGA